MADVPILLSTGPFSAATAGSESASATVDELPFGLTAAGVPVSHAPHAPVEQSLSLNTAFIDDPINTQGFRQSATLTLPQLLPPTRSHSAPDLTPRERPYPHPLLHDDSDDDTVTETTFPTAMKSFSRDHAPKRTDFRVRARIHLPPDTVNARSLPNPESDLLMRNDIENAPVIYPHTARELHTLGHSAYVVSGPSGQIPVPRVNIDAIGTKELGFGSGKPLPDVTRGEQTKAYSAGQQNFQPGVVTRAMSASAINNDGKERANVPRKKTKAMVLPVPRDANGKFLPKR